MSRGDLELEQATVNIKAIAQVCGSSPDIVSNFLQKLKDFAVSFSKDKKRTVILNVYFGHMVLYPNQTVEFKSADLNQSQASQPQQIADRKQLYARDKSIFNTANSKDGVNSLLLDGQNDYTHLSDFLKNQIYRGTEKVQAPKSEKGADYEDTYSVISKRNRYSNALIEKASHQMR